MSASGEPTARLIEALDGRLIAYGFVRTSGLEPVEGTPGAEVWTHKTLFANRAVALMQLPEEETEPGEYAQRIKMPLGRQIGYFPVLSALGLQIVMTTDAPIPPGTDLHAHVDVIDNQRVVLQSVFLVNLREKTHVSSRTWGQLFSGRFQAAIEKAIADLC